MAVLDIRLYPDPVLREAAPAVEPGDPSLTKLVTDMLDTMDAANGAGLAAPQVGVQRRVFVYDVGEGAVALVNPQILARRGEVVDNEGCLSIPGISLPVTRAEWVEVAGTDPDGEPLRFEATDLEARVIQHELDHLDGVLFLDRLDRKVRREAMRMIRERQLHATAPSGEPANVL